MNLSKKTSQPYRVVYPRLYKRPRALIPPQKCNVYVFRMYSTNFTRRGLFGFRVCIIREGSLLLLCTCRYAFAEWSGSAKNTSLNFRDSPPA